MRTRHPHGLARTLGIAAILTSTASWAAAQTDAASPDAGTAGQNQAQTEAGTASASSDPGTDGEIRAQTAATFIDTDGNEIGGANITDVPTGGVLIGVQVEGLPAETWHALHVHEGGECNPEDGFESAGGHFNPDESEHGFYVESGPHAGDMPNQFVPESGVLRTQVFNPRVSLNGEQPTIHGRAIVIHARQDDYESQPSGNAGDRLACAVIE